MKKLLLLLFALAPSLALAQNAPSVTPPVLAAGAYNSSTPTCTTGNGCYLQTDSHGNLNVNIAGGGGSGGTSQTDQAAFTYGTTAYTPGGCVYNSSITNLTSGQGGAFSCDNTRALFINVLSGSTLYNLLSAGAATNGSTYPSSSLGVGWKDGSGNIQPFAAATPGPVQPTGGTTGGLSPYQHIADNSVLGGSNGVVIKASAGQVYKVSITNNSSTYNYVRLYNSAGSAGAFSGCNSATNLIYANAIPPAGVIDSWQLGMSGFTSGISICITSGFGNTDTTNATASAINVNVGYK